MYGFKLVFIVLSLWALVYALSYFVYSVRRRFIYQAVSSIILSLAGTALCVIYIIYL